MNKTKQKTQVTLGDLKELWYMMECPCSFQEFVADYDEDDDFDVINSWICTTIGLDEAIENLQSDLEQGWEKEKEIIDRLDPENL